MEQSLNLGQGYDIAEYVQKWGNSASIALFDPACQIFSAPGVRGIIGYKFVKKCAIVFGDPVCPAEDLRALVQAFHDFCKRYKKTIVYAAATQHFMDWAMHTFCHSAIAVGKEIILDPSQDIRLQKGKNASSMRNKYSFSVKQGITIHEYDEFDQTIEQELEHLSMIWSQNRTGPQIYLLQVNIFADRTNKRYFYARHNGKIVGLLVLNRIDAYQGWVLNIVMLAPDAPTTTSEFLVMSMLEVLRAQGCAYFSVGTTATAELDAIVGFNSILKLFIKNAYRIIQRIFPLEDRHRYWKKFQPQTVPTYVLFCRNRIGIAEIIGIMRAFNVRL